MRKIELKLKKEMQDLEKIINEASKRLKSAPKGQLRISNKGNCVEYYYKDEEVGSNGRYMKKKELALAKKIAQRDLDMQVVKCAQGRKRAIATFLKKYKELDLNRVYEKIHPCRRDLIEDKLMSDMEFVRAWQAVEYRGKSFGEDEKEIVTEKGEKVRSKSEKIIADKLYTLGVPYRYEFPLSLDGNIKIYPDFTILRMPEREEVYLEHFGKMDDNSYVDNVMFKLSTYEKNEIYLGVNLFVTYETGKNPLNTRSVDKLIKKLFL